MTPLKEIGECVISAGGNEYFFRPSFRNMSRIGEPDEIVQTFHDLFTNNAEVIVKQAFANFGFVPYCIREHASRIHIHKKSFFAAHSVIAACCDDDVSKLTGWMEKSKTGDYGMVWRRGLLSPEQMLIAAQWLIVHGVIGKTKVRKLQREEGKGTTSEFRAAEYIMAARNHFGISREEAENLTMTEFAMMINAKYPEQKGFTREEYDAVMDDDDRRWQEMINREKANK